MNLMRSKLKDSKRMLFALVGVLSLAALFLAQGSSAEEARVVPAPVFDETAHQNGSETAILAGGCFWGVQGVFQHVAGVSSAVSGYTGGDAATAHYRVVGTGRTGHAESVRITFDPSKVTYGHLLQIYFSVAHDPTQLNRQGPDSGTQYRSTIFPTTPGQAKIAAAYIDQLNGAHVFPKPIVTTIETGKTFYPAEGYHQNFLALNPTYPYIVVNDLPKVANLKRLFPKNYRAEPVLVAAAKPSN
jgi:peptide-methionine (S)-S-oxide reductase